MSNKLLKIYTFYRFKNLKGLKKIKKEIYDLTINKKIFGTILIAEEGINGTISGEKKKLDFFISSIKKIIKIRNLTLKISENNYVPFYRMKVRIKKEIVTIGIKSITPDKKTGTHIAPSKWDKILNNKNYLVIDVRNKYEVDIGTFKNSKNPHINSFREFPNYIKKQNLSKNQPIAMFCTGGIRCEKASSYLMSQGFKDVSQLDGGILNYLEYKKIKKKSLWKGQCFVFDNRVAVDKKLKRGKYDQCYGCRHPITEKEKKLKSFKKGISCKYCTNKRSRNQIKSSSTRQSQIDKAEKIGVNHPFRKITLLDYSKS
ncbi:rhodanese-related sulfurtransferase [Pelagibacteraceae bacterium]|nr:rhodanese-related sulfurtransferase [Pelagibacteraceae bacterium]